MTHKIVVSNQKGGVGKTTTSTALAAGLGKRGYKVLAVDADPQANFSDTAIAENYENPTLCDVIKGECDAQDAVQKCEYFDIIPSNIMLAGFETEQGRLGKEQRMKEYIDPIAQQYDYVIVDTPPSLGLLTINAFTFANEIIIPTTAGIYATAGMVQLSETISNVRKYCYNNELTVVGILMTRYNPRANLNKDMRDLAERIANELKMPIFNTYIRNSIAVDEAQAHKKDIFSYKATATVAEDYSAFIEEYLQIQKIQK